MSKTWCSGGSEKAGPDSSTKPLYIGYRVRVKKKGGCGGSMRLRRRSQLVWNCALQSMSDVY